MKRTLILTSALLFGVNAAKAQAPGLHADGRPHLLDIQADRLALLSEVAGEARACGLKSKDWETFVALGTYGGLGRIADNIWPTSKVNAREKNARDEAFITASERLDKAGERGAARAPADCGRAGLIDEIGVADSIIKFPH